MTSPEVIFTICRRTTASPYYILKSLLSNSWLYVFGGEWVFERRSEMILARGGGGGGQGLKWERTT